MPGSLDRAGIFPLLQKKDLDPLMKYYNNQNIKQKIRSFIEAWMGIKSPSCRRLDAFSGDIGTVHGEGMPGLRRPQALQGLPGQIL
jgi:hypothetical protein